jgi:hypothetical protein
MYVQRARQLHDLLMQYVHTIESINERRKQLEISEYQRLDFDRRCSKWNDSIGLIEQRVASIVGNLPTNYHGLLHVDRLLAETIGDFDQRQQELLRLIAEGKQLIEQKFITNPIVFVQLEVHWKTLVQNAHKQRDHVKETIQWWHRYQQQLDSKSAHRTDPLINGRLFRLLSLLEPKRRRSKSATLCTKHCDDQSISTEHL